MKKNPKPVICEKCSGTAWKWISQLLRKCLNCGHQVGMQ